jgi:hypothetical protein
METALQHQTTTQFTGLSAAGTGSLALRTDQPGITTTDAIVSKELDQK